MSPEETEDPATNLASVHAALAHYPSHCGPRRVESLGSAGGFSGARFWRLATEAGPLCLRCWPREHPNPARLEQIHAVLLHVASAGIDFVPAPIRERRGQTLVQIAGRLWELTPWVPGQADYRLRPSPAKLRAALESLAKFHVSASTALPDESSRPGPSRGLLERQELLHALIHGGTAQIQAATRRRASPQFSQRAEQLFGLFPRLAPRVAERLKQVAQYPVLEQPCIRDIWHDHILFTGDVVTGIVDFGAMRRDTVAGDLARLLGSLVGDDPAGRQHGLAAYQKVRPLTDDEQALVEVFDVSSVLLSGMNWLRWIYVEGREFDHQETILGRLDEIVVRLEHRLGPGP